MISQGTDDVVAIAAGPQHFPWRVMSERTEMQVHRRSDDIVVAWYAARLGDIAAHPAGRAWAGLTGRDLHLIQLEGYAL